MGRQVLRGIVDTLFLAVLTTLVAANTGFLPAEGLQTTASAGFGICSMEQCPGSCPVWMVTPTNEPPYFVWTEDLCQVDSPNTQWTGYCDGICGICPLSSRCSGSTVITLMPCLCVEQGC